MDKPYPQRLLVSRADNIGDVLLTLPMLGYVKQRWAGVRIFFLGTDYTSPLLSFCSHIDQICSWSFLENLSLTERINHLKQYDLSAVIHVLPRYPIAKTCHLAQIPLRIGTAHRWYHWLYCNHRVWFSRYHSAQHESQLNFQLLSLWGKTPKFSLQELRKYSGFSIKNSNKIWLNSKLPDPQHTRKRIVLQPMSRGHAQEWSLRNYAFLAQDLASRGFLVLFSGTEKEGRLYRPHLKRVFSEAIIDISGKYHLNHFIQFLAEIDIMVGGSTGPLHIAAMLGKRVIGLYPSDTSMHPDRWSPLGKYVTIHTPEKSSLQQPSSTLDAISWQRVSKSIS